MHHREWPSSAGFPPSCVASLKCALKSLIIAPLSIMIVWRIFLQIHDMFGKSQLYIYRDPPLIYQQRFYCASIVLYGNSTLQCRYCIFSIVKPKQGQYMFTSFTQIAWSLHNLSWKVDDFQVPAVHLQGCLQTVDGHYSTAHTYLELLATLSVILGCGAYEY